MPSRQTTIFSHFSPSQQNKAGPSRNRQSRNAKPKYEEPESESEGSEGLDHVKMKDTQPDRNKLTMTQRRALKNRLYDSDDERIQEEEGETENDDDDELLQETPKRRKVGRPRKGLGKGKGKHREEEYETTDPEEEYISRPLTGRLPAEYRGNHSQRVKRRNDKLEAVEIQRKKQRQDILTDDEIEVFPSPPSPSNRNARKRRNVEIGKFDSMDKSNGKGKGERIAANKDDDDDDDDIVPIDPPISKNQKSARITNSKISQNAEIAPSPDSKVTRPRGRPRKQPMGKPRLDLQRTKSEVIVEIPRMSQEDRRSYSSFTPSQSSQSTSKPAPTNKDKGKYLGSLQNTSDRTLSKSKIPVVEIPSRRSSPAQNSTTNESLPPILELEYSDDDLAVLTDEEKDGDGNKAKSKSKSKSPIKRGSPVKQPSPAKPSSVPQGESSSPKKVPSPAKQPAIIQHISPPRSPPSARKASPAKRRQPSPFPSNSSSSSTPIVAPSKQRDKGKGKQKGITSSDEEDSLPIRRPAKTGVPSRKSSSKTKVPEKHHRVKSKPKIVDPDGVDTEEEEDMVGDLKMDEPERFKSKTRLRKRPKESVMQRNIRKLKNKRLGIVESSTDNSSSEESAPTNSDGSSSGSKSDEQSFIVEDDDATGPQVQLPHEFSVDSAQTPEFKFKVVFHYLVLLVMKGRKAFPLSAESSNYFKPQLLHLRDRMTGYRQLRVRSQIWRANFVKALEKYPIFDVEELVYAEPGCDACHMGGRMSKFRVTLDGEPYDKETHQPLDSSSSEEEESEDSDDSDATERARKKLPKSMLMGRFCKQRAEVFHQMSHWEDELYHRIRGYYRDLLRAKYKPVPSDSEASTPESERDPDEDINEVNARKQNRNQRKISTETRCEKLRKRGGLPNDTKDVDAVTEWMDKMGFQNKDFRWIERLIDQSDQLEHDKRRDE